MAFSFTIGGGSIAPKTPEQIDTMIEFLHLYKTLTVNSGGISVIETLPTLPDVTSARLRKCLAWINKTFPHKKMKSRSALAEMLEFVRVRFRVTGTQSIPRAGATTEVSCRVESRVAVFL